MNNKILAIFGLAGLWLLFGIGFLEGLTDTIIADSDGFYMVVGVWEMVFITWGLVRLYKIK